MVAHIKRHRTSRPIRKPVEVEFEINHLKLTGTQIKRFLQWYYRKIDPSHGHGMPSDIKDILKQASTIEKAVYPRMKQDDEWVLPGRSLKQSEALRALDKKKQSVVVKKRSSRVVRVRRA